MIFLGCQAFGMETHRKRTWRFRMGQHCILLGKSLDESSVRWCCEDKGQMTMSRSPAQTTNSPSTRSTSLTPHHVDQCLAQRRHSERVSRVVIAKDYFMYLIFKMVQDSGQRHIFIVPIVTIQYLFHWIFPVSIKNSLLKVELSIFLNLCFLFLKIITPFYLRGRWK